MKPRNSIIIRLMGGLGNQLFQYAFGRSLSIRSGRDLLLETGIISGDLYRNYALSAFNIQEQHVGTLNKRFTRWAGSNSTGKLFRALWPLPLDFVQDKENGFDPSIYNLKKGTCIFQGNWQSFKYFESYQDVIRTEFTFKREPTLQNSHMIDEIEAVQSVAVHVRRGDYITNPKVNALLGVCPLEYYQKANDFIQQKVKKPHFFIFTDDPKWVKKSLIFPGPTKVVDHNLGIADYEDFRLMTHCKHFIIANSSFSWWGAWLAHYVNKIIISPMFYSSEDRDPKEWIRL